MTEEYIISYRLLKEAGRSPVEARCILTDTPYAYLRLEEPEAHDRIAKKFEGYIN